MLRTARIKKRMSQIDLSRKLGITQSYLSRIEHRHLNTKHLSIDLVLRLSKELEICPIIVFLYLASLRPNCQLCCRFCIKEIKTEL